MRASRRPAVHNDDGREPSPHTVPRDRPALTALLGGQVQVQSPCLPLSVEFIRTGKERRHSWNHDRETLGGAAGSSGDRRLVKGHRGELRGTGDRRTEGALTLVVQILNSVDRRGLGDPTINTQSPIWAALRLLGMPEISWQASSLRKRKTGPRRCAGRYQKADQTVAVAPKFHVPFDESEQTRGIAWDLARSAAASCMIVGTTHPRPPDAPGLGGGTRARVRRRPGAAQGGKQAILPSGRPPFQDQGLRRGAVLVTLTKWPTEQHPRRPDRAAFIRPLRHA